MKKILILLTLVLLMTQFAACNTTQRVISNVSQKKINNNPHVAAWLAEDRSGAYDSINNHLFVYKTFLQGDGRNIYKIILLRENVEKQSDIKLEFVEEETKITVKIHLTDKKKDAVDGRTVSYIEFKASSNKEMYYDVICEGESRELLQYTDVNIAM